MKILRMSAAFMVLFGIMATASAQWAVTDPSEPSYSAELQLQYQATRNASEQRSLFAKSLYVEKSLGGSVSVTFIGYHDEEFWSMYPGLAWSHGNVEVGLGVGSAHYDGRSHTTLNPWVWYGNDELGIEAQVYVERYLSEHDDPWYVKAYVRKRVGDLMFGVYEDSIMGAGPLAGVYLGKHLRLWAYVPVVGQPSTGRMRGAITLTYEF
ncbi:MAG TPA: hypothetical protein VFS75_01475 [Candidatus Paceibacterota bacterium]|nr:hypothetical protein [Candidatus Paceibacterota bacterium]